MRRFQLIQGRNERPTSETLPPFEEALLAHLDSLFAFALRLVGGERARAEDLVQEVCLRAFRSYSSLRSRQKIKSWLFQILVHTHINEFRRIYRRPVLDVELSEALLDSAPSRALPNPEEHFFAQLLDAEIQQALDALPLEFRTVVWLFDVEELSYQEIAKILHCPEGTVASRLYRGRTLLREQLWEYARNRGLVKE